MNLAKEMALRFFNALHHKSEELLAGCFQVGKNFEDVLPNGTVVKSADDLLTLHTHFFANPKTGFRPFDKNGSTHRPFEARDLESAVEFEGGGFFRIAAEVDRQQDFRDKTSAVIRKYMYIGVVVKDDGVRHVQNTPFEPLSASDPH